MAVAGAYAATGFNDMAERRGTHLNSKGLLFFCMVMFLFSCEQVPEREDLVVTASAYNSVPSQTSGDPYETAWGDRLEPDMKAIAVSRDLIDLGLTYKTLVRIEGLEGDYVVLDKMAARWEKHIDIYMGDNVQAARKWGRRQVRISWIPSK